jgi:hypothetical protein
MRIASQITHVTAVKNICLRSIPWRRTKLVCAPIATIKLAQVKKPFKNIKEDWSIAAQFKILNRLVNIA